MLQLIEGAGVLLLLSMFLAYLLAPALPPIRRRIRIGRRRRPISDAAAIVLIYLAVFVPGAVIWRKSEAAVKHWIAVTAPASVDRLFAGGTIAPLDAIFAPLPSATSDDADANRDAGRCGDRAEHARDARGTDHGCASTRAGWW